MTHYYTQFVKALTLVLFLFASNTQAQIISTIAGTQSNQFAYTGDGGIGTGAYINNPNAVCLDASGNIYIAESGRIRKYNVSTGTITTIAGNGTQGYSGDGSLATSAQIYGDGGIALDKNGNLFIADSYNQRIRKVTASTGIIITYAGTGTQGYSGDGGLATGANISCGAICVDTVGNVYFTNTISVRKINASSGIITTIAGNGTNSYWTEGSLATNADLGTLNGLCIDKNGNIYISQYYSKILKVTSAGVLSTFAGTGNSGFSGDGGLATAATFGVPRGVTIDNLGTLYFCDAVNQVIRKVNTTGIISTIAGTVGSYGFIGDGSVATSAKLHSPLGICVNAAGIVYIADQANYRIRSVNTSTGIINTIVGGGVGDGNVASISSLRYPQGLASDSTGNIYIADMSNNLVRKIDIKTGKISSVAGHGDINTGNAGFAGDGGLATIASLNTPQGVNVDASGNIYIADYQNHVIRKVAASSGIITTVAGNNSSGVSSGDGGLATSAGLSPSSVCVDGSGNIYIADVDNNRIRKVTISTGIITTIAGTGTAGHTGDGASATLAKINQPNGISVDASGNIYFTETYYVRKITAATGIITTIAGGGGVNPGDGGMATATALYLPFGITLDANANIYFADKFYNRIRKITAATGVITTLAGTGTAGYSGDGGLPTGALINNPQGVAVDKSGNVYFSEYGNNTIRKVTYQVVPTITSFSPTTAATGNTVTIKGKYFTGATAVSFGGTAATSFSVVNDTTITAIVGTGTSGSVSITTGGGKSSLASFSYLPAPNISYAGGTKTYTVGTAITAISPINTGGAVSENGQVVVSTFAGSGYGGVANGIGTAASFNYPYGITVDAQGSFYVADTYNYKIRKITSDGSVSSFVGNASSLSHATGIACDKVGNIYVSDNQNNRILKINSAGNIAVLAGDYAAGNVDATGSAARFSYPNRITVDVQGNVYVTDYSNYKIRKITANGVVTTLAGSGTQGSADGVGALASFGNLNGISVDILGNIYVADDYKIRKITPSGVVSTFAGSGVQGSTDGTGVSASFYGPSGLTIDLTGNILVSDLYRIRKITPNGIVTTIAGSGVSGNVDGIGIAASFNSCFGIALDSVNNIFVADVTNNKIRKITTSYGYSITPTLPTGLSFDGSTGTISGTPNVTTTSTVYTITATNMAGSSSTTISISTVAPPTVTTFTPTTALTGTIVTIKGTKFTGATAISFGGTAATNYTVVNDSTISAVVGSGSSGSVAVTTSWGTAGKTGFLFCSSPITKPISYSSCSSVVYKTKTYTSSTVVRDTLKSIGGCDSIYNVATITITPITPTTISYSYSNCKSVLYNGITYTSSTVKRDTTKSVSGCDSIYKVATITITPITPTTINYTYSNCKSVLYNGITYTSSTIKRDTTKSVGGCDSIYKVATITITPITPTTISYSYSNCKSVIYNGVTYTYSTIKRDTTKSVGGCDSIYKVATITITPITPTTISYSYSNCKSVVYNGVTYTSSTVKRDTTKSVGGCDSVYKVATITITPTTPTTINYSYSNCKSVLYNGVTYTSSTIKRDTTKSVGGCDSIYKVATITITPITPTTISYSYSNCKSVIYNGVTYTSSTVKRDTTKSVGGCDSIYKVATITITPITPTTISYSYTNCKSVVYNGFTYTSSTIKRDTTKSVGGCDSIYKVATITITPITPTTINYTYSNCKSVLYNGITYTSSTIKRDTTKSVGGCDSVYKVATITITPIMAVTKAVTYASCSSYVYKSKTYSTSTTVKDTVKSVGGCDSIFNVATITINTPVVPTINAVGKNPLCAGAGDSLVLTTASATAQWIRNNSAMPSITGAKYVAKLYGSYSVVFTDANGCMAKSAPVLVNELFVPAPTITISYGSVLTSSYDDGNQWYKDYTTLVATSKTYSQLDTSVVAQYSVQAVVNGCKSPMSNPIVNTRDSLNSININCPTVVKPTTFATQDVLIIYEGAAPLKVNLYPNPTSSNSYVQVTGAAANAVVQITDIQGKAIWKTTIGSSKTITLPAGTLASGLYIVSVTSGSQHEELKWIINR